MSRSAAARFTAAAALAGVSLIAAVVSYLHGLAVVEVAGARPPVAYLIPFLADLVILGASAALLDASRSSRGWPVLASVSLAAGVGVTLVMNVAAGWRNGPGSALVAGWPAVAFILALESLAGIARRGRGGLPVSPVPATPGQQQPVAPADTGEALRLLLATGSRRELAEVLSVPKSRVDSWAAKAGRLADPAVGGRGRVRDLSAPVTLSGGRDTDTFPPMGVPAAPDGGRGGEYAAAGGGRGDGLGGPAPAVLNGAADR